MNILYGSETPWVTRSSINTPVYEIGAIEDDRGDAGRKPGRVEPRDKALSRRLFVPRGAIDLAGEKQAFGSFDHKRSVKFARIDVVVFDRVTRT